MSGKQEKKAQTAFKTKSDFTCQSVVGLFLSDYLRNENEISY